MGSHVDASSIPERGHKGQVRSECLTCPFRASCCSARLSRVQVPAFTGYSVQDRKKRGRSKGGSPALAGTREYEQSDRNRVAGGGFHKGPM